MAAYFTSPAARALGLEARRAVRALAGAKQVTIETRFDGSWHEILLTAPAGSRFEPELHELVVANAGAMTDGLWEHARLTLQDATVEPCDDPTCEWCHDEEVG